MCDVPPVNTCKSKAGNVLQQVIRRSNKDKGDEMALANGPSDVNGISVLERAVQRHQIP